MIGKIVFKDEHQFCAINNANINILYEHRLIEIKKENKTTIIPFESIVYIEFESK